MDARGFSFSSIGDGAEFHRRQRLIVDCTKDSVRYSRLKSSERLTGWINRLWGGGLRFVTSTKGLVHPNKMDCKLG